MPYPAKINKAKALDLRRQGLTYKDIGKVIGASAPSIYMSIKDLLPTEETTTFINARADVLSEIQRRILSSLTPECINAAPLQARAVSFAVLYDKERIERNLSSSNVDIRADISIMQGLSGIKPLPKPIERDEPEGVQVKK